MNPDQPITRMSLDNIEHAVEALCVKVFGAAPLYPQPDPQPDVIRLNRQDLYNMAESSTPSMAKAIMEIATLECVGDAEYSPETIVGTPSTNEAEANGCDPWEHARAMETLMRIGYVCRSGQERRHQRELAEAREMAERYREAQKQMREKYGIGPRDVMKELRKKLADVRRMLEHESRDAVAIAEKLFAVTEQRDGLAKALRHAVAGSHGWQVRAKQALAAVEGGEKATIITKNDAQLLREILRRWNILSNLSEGDNGYDSMTDHCHSTYDEGEELAAKLESMAGIEPIGETPPPHPPKYDGQTCHLCGAKDYACEHIPGVPF